MALLPIPIGDFIRFLKKKHKGFSLVELSIVLVILGLLVGGVLSGQSLIRAAEMRSVGTQASQFITATMTFRDKYTALPGDMANATKFWGAASASYCPGDDSNITTGKETCDGNGDGTLNPNINTSSKHERFRYWQHLANAGLIEGHYTGYGGTNGGHATADNVPLAKISSGMWFADYAAQFDSSNSYGFLAGNYNSYLQIGKKASTNSDPGANIFKPEEMWNIDVKMDDGKPGQGRVVMRHYNTCTTASSASEIDASYAVSSSNVGCVGIFRDL